MIARLREFLANPIIIGQPECPIFARWAIVGGGSLGRPLIGARDGFPFSLKVHHFFSRADDRDVHDHPWAFWTLVLRGSYDDMAACQPCDGTGSVTIVWSGGPREHRCANCDGEGVVLRERMTPGKLRFRPAQHAHRTQVGPKGCWTLVLTGPKVRSWGFWRLGRFWGHKDYEAQFGPAMRCDA